MTAREELEDRLNMLMMSANVNIGDVKDKLFAILTDFEVDYASKELVVYDTTECNQKVLEKFLVNKAVAGLTKRSLESYRYWMNFFFKRIQIPYNMIQPDDIKLYLAKRKVQDGVSETQILNEWRVYSTFFGWLWREEIIPKNPMIRVEKPKRRKTQKKAFTHMEIEIMRNNLKNSRDKALYEVLLSTWCRVSEVAQMNIADIEGDKMTVLGKGEKERVVYLNSKAKLAIDNYLKERTDDNPALFVSLDKPYHRLKSSGIEIVIRKNGDECCFEKVHPHRFRRTGATFALRNGMPIEKVSYLLGHESIETTQIYLDMNEQEAEAAHKKYVN